MAKTPNPASYDMAGEIPKLDPSMHARKATSPDNRDGKAYPTGKRRSLSFRIGSSYLALALALGFAGTVTFTR
jgi:hypothetical protein